MEPRRDGWPLGGASGVRVALTDDRWTRPLATAGLAGALIFLTVLVGVGIVHGRTALDNTLSAASVESPLATLLVLGQVLHALGLVALGLAAGRRLPGDGIAGPVALVVAGVAGLCLVRFPCGPACQDDGLDPGETAHVVAATLAGLAMIVAPVLIGWRTCRASRRWRSYRSLCILASAAFIVGLLAWAATAGRPGAGLAERGALAVSALWVAATAWWARRSTDVSQGE